MSEPLVPPIARIVPHTFEHLGRTFTDNYAWLQDKADPEVLAYLQAENDYARASLQHTEALQQRIYAEMRARIQEDDSSAPQAHGAYFYYWRMQAGQQYRRFCRKQASLESPEEILLDENLLAQGQEYCRVLLFEPSPDHTLLAYSVDTSGAFIYDLYVKDLRTGQVISGPIPNTAWTAAWASDNSLFYTCFDDAHRPFKLFRHLPGASPETDALIYHEPDDAYPIYVERTRSGAYLLLTIASASTSEVRYLPAGQPTAAWQVIQPRQHWLEYYAEHHGGRFLIRTNDGAENFKLVEAPLASPGKEHWRELLPHRPDVLVEEVSAFRDFVVVYERQAGLRRMRLSAPDLLSGLRYVDFPDPVYTFKTAPNPEFDTPSLRFYYSSLVTPESTIDVNMRSGAWEVKKRQEIPSGYDPAEYVSERLHALAPDGARVPISLLYRKDLPRDGSAPLLMEGYGSYGYSYDPAFDTRRLSLVDRGFVFAIAHVRGGSELGRAWYENGRLMNKVNTFTDFIACAEHLVAQGYTSPQRLAIQGGSAGGLLVSAVANMRPDLFKAVVALVPFTNVINAMLLPDLPLTVVEYEQWGHPDDPQAFDYMASYSPYENVQAQAYPHILARAGWNDLQVPYWDPAKWVAKLRAHKTGSNRLLLLTNMGAGHSGASGRYDHLLEDAQNCAFILDTLGV
ncbi:MAG: S9 family peptidase [Chloroflexota bacterium]